ncbi:MAG: hypothetical protein ACT4P7_02975 [Gemmatimonadaceae bacterium]
MAPRPRRFARHLAPRVRIAVVVATLSAACLGEGDLAVSGPAKCGRPAQIPDTVACAVIFGTVTNTRGDALDGIEGSVRVSATCGCRDVTLQVDERGIFSATVYRVGVGGLVPTADTATGTVLVLATAPKYPRHSTGAPYFDTTRVVMRFAPVGSAPVPLETRLRIPIPLPGT